MKTDDKREQALLESLDPDWQELVPAAEPPEGFADTVTAAVADDGQPEVFDPAASGAADLAGRRFNRWLIAACLVLIAAGALVVWQHIESNSEEAVRHVVADLASNDGRLEPAVPTDGPPPKDSPGGAAVVRDGPVVEAPERPEPRTLASAKEPVAATPPKTLLTGVALTIYQAGELETLIERAEELKVSAEARSALQRFESSWRRGLKLAKMPGQTGDALASLDETLELDRLLGGGEGVLRRPVLKVLAKVHFIIGVDSHTRRQYEKAYRHLKKAQEYGPDMGQVIKRLRELEKMAKRLYEVAYVIKGTNPDKAIENCRTVMGMVDPDHVYYAKSKQLAERLERGESGRVSPGY